MLCVKYPLFITAILDMERSITMCLKYKIPIYSVHVLLCVRTTKINLNPVQKGRGVMISMCIACL